MKIICFLTVRPSELFYNYCKILKNDNYDVYIFIDDNQYSIPNCDHTIHIIKLDNELCESDGFKNTVSYCKHKSCSRDKALYYFCKDTTINYEYIWFIEEDVFIPDVDTILKIDDNYKDGDLISESNAVCYDNKRNWSHWDMCIEECKLELPFCKGMICAIRVSPKMLTFINDYANKYKTLFFCEILFNTLAYQNNLTIINPKELSTIEYRRDWSKNEIQKTHLYHPMKCIKTQYEYREYCNTNRN